MISDHYKLPGNHSFKSINSTTLFECSSCNIVIFFAEKRWNIECSSFIELGIYYIPKTCEEVKMIKALK